jgi:hypothetical protein
MPVLLRGPDRACQRDGAGSRPAAAHCGRRIIHYRYDPERHGRLVYNGTLRNAVLIIGGAGIVMLLIFLLRPLICGGPIVHHQEELARD